MTAGRGAWDLLYEGIVCQKDSLWKLIRTAGLGELERLLDVLNKGQQDKYTPLTERRRHVYGYPSLTSYSVVDENINRNLQYLAQNTNLTAEAKQELVTHLVQAFTDVDAKDLQPVAIENLAVIRRSVLLITLYNALWQSSSNANRNKDVLSWNRVVDLVAWAADADVTIDPDLIQSDCQALIIDVEKRVYASTICRRANEAFHDEYTHQRIIGYILTLFVFGYWDHALSLVDRCFTYPDEAYQDFLNLLSFHFPRVRYSWDDIGNPSHPMRDEGTFQRFRLDIRRAFIDESHLKMNENHILRPIVILLGCVPQLLNDCESISESSVTNEFAIMEQKTVPTGISDDIDELISNLFEVYRETRKAEAANENKPNSLENSFTVSWFCCTLFWNRYHFMSLLQQNPLPGPENINEKDIEMNENLNAIGYLYQLWAKEKKIEERNLPVTDVAYSLLIGNDIDRLLALLEARRESFLPLLPFVLGALCFFDFHISTCQIARLLVQAIPDIVSVIQLRNEANDWSLKLEQSVHEILDPCAMFLMLLIRVEDSTEFQSWESPDWWESEALHALNTETDKPVKPCPALVYTGVDHLLNIVLFADPNIADQVKVDLLKCLIQQHVSSPFAYLELQRTAGNIAARWVSENEGKQNADMSPLPQSFHSARELFSAVSSPMVKTLSSQADLVDKALGASQYFRVVDTTVFEVGLLSLLLRAKTPAVTDHEKVQVFRRAYESVLNIERKHIKIDAKQIWRLLSEIAEAVSMSKMDVDQILQMYSELLDDQEESMDIRLLKIKTARSLVLNSTES